MRRQVPGWRRLSSPDGSAESGELRVLLSVVVPCSNEQEVLRETNRRLATFLESLPLDFEIVYVDDGSTDSTPALLRELQAHDDRIRVLRLSRNFGHQVAITAGLEHASGQAVVVIDADLQDPPEVIGEFVKQWREGYDVVYGIRTEREGEAAFKLWTAKAFYRVINHLSDTSIPLDAGDFRLMDRTVVDALLSMPERDRFVRGMVSWLGFSQVGAPYRRAPRQAGVTKFSLFKMLRFAMDGIVSFSIVPLRLATWLGLASSGLAILGGVQLVCLGIIGEYIGRIYGESKRRPLYLVQERIGFEAQDRTGPPDLQPRLAAGGGEGSVIEGRNRDRI